jgi:hypothetical protein
MSIARRLDKPTSQAGFGTLRYPLAISCVSAALTISLPVHDITMTKPVMLANGRCWGSRAESLEHFRQILAQYRNGDRISDPSHHDDLCALLTMYDSSVMAGFPTKTGSGISHFSRQRNAGYRWSTNGFHVHRTDGTSIGFSYANAVRSPSSLTTPFFDRSLVSA